MKDITRESVRKSDCCRKTWLWKIKDETNQYRKEAKDAAGLLNLGPDSDEGGDFQNGPE
jgi:hypothetical protein